MFHSLWILNRSICIAFTMPTPAWFEARYLLSKSSQGMFQYFPNAMIFGVFLCAMTVVCTLIIYLHNLALLVLQSLELCWVWFTLHLQCPNLGVLQEGPSCLNLLKGKSNLFSLARIFGVFLCDIRVQLFFFSFSFAFYSNLMSSIFVAFTLWKHACLVRRSLLFKSSQR